MAQDSSAQRATEAELLFRQVAQDLPTPCRSGCRRIGYLGHQARSIAYTGMDAGAIGSSGLKTSATQPSYPQRSAAMEEGQG